MWQLRRLEERQAFNKVILAGLNAPSITLTGQHLNPDELHLRRVSVTGTFDNDEDVILRGRSYRSRQGAELVVPLLMEGSEQAILVNRGWIPLENSDPESRQMYNLEDSVTIEGIAHRTQTRPDAYFAPTDPLPQPGQDGLDAWFRVDIERIQAQVDYPLAPIFIEQSSDPESTMPPLGEENIDLSDGPHLGYALQWFSFAIILIILYAIFARQELKRKG